MANVGTAYVDIKPDVSGFSRALGREISKSTKMGSQAFTKEFTQGITGDLSKSFKPVGNILEREAGKAGDKAGQEASSKFGRSFSNNKKGGATWSIRTLATSIIALGPAAIPAFAAVSGAAVLAGSAIASAGAATGLFGLAAKAQLTPVFDAFKNLTAARKAYDAATTKAGRDRALEQQSQILARLTPQQRDAVKGILRLQTAWHNFGSTARGPIFSAFGASMRGLVNVMKTFEPAVKPIAMTIASLIKEFEAWTKGTGGLTWLARWMGNTGPRAITVFVDAMRDVGVGVGNLFRSVAGITQTGKGFLTWLTQTTTHFRTWSGSTSAVSSLMTVFQKVGPNVAKLLGAMATALGAIVVAMGPLGGVSLQVLTMFAQAVTTIAVHMPWLVQGLWAAFVAIKALTLASAALNIVLDANPVMLIVVAVAALAAGLIWAYKNVGWFKTAVDATVHGTVVAWNWLVNAVAVATRWLFNNVIKPVWAGIQIYIRVIIFAVMTYINIWKFVITTLAKVMMWLYRNVVLPVFGFIKAYISFVVGVVIGYLKVWRFIIMNVLAPAMWWLYSNVIHPVWTAIATVTKVYFNIVRGIFNVFKWLLQVYLAVAFWAILSVVKIVWSGIVYAIKAAHTIIRGIFGGIKSGITDLARWFLGLFNAWIKPIWNWISDKFVWGRKRVGIEFGIIKAAMTDLGRWFLGLLNSWFTPIWNGIKIAFSAGRRAIDAVFQGIKKGGFWLVTQLGNAFDAIKSAVWWVGRTFETTASWIGRVWKSIESAAAKPIRFVIDTVWNKGVGGLYSALRDKLHIPGLPKFPTVKFATGGIYPGYTPGKDVGYAHVSGGEAIMRPEWTRAVGPEFVHAGNAAARKGGVSGVQNFMGNFMGGFDGGGIIGGLISGVKKIGSIAATPLKWGAGIVRKIGAEGLAHVAKPMFDGIMNTMSKTVGGGTITDAIKGMGNQVIDKLIGWLEGKVSGGSGGAADIVKAAIAELGQGEQPAGSNNTKYGKWYGINPAAWCDMFVSYVANKSGTDKAVGKFSYVPDHMNYFRGKGEYSQGGAGAKPGDVAFFGGGSHVGLVEKAMGNGRVGTIEGNHSSIVQRVNRAVSEITSLGHPKYGAGRSGGGGAAWPGGGGHATVGTFWDTGHSGYGDTGAPASGMPMQKFSLASRHLIPYGKSIIARARGQNRAAKFVSIDYGPGITSRLFDLDTYGASWLFGKEGGWSSSNPGGSDQSPGVFDIDWVKAYKNGGIVPLSLLAAMQGIDPNEKKKPKGGGPLYDNGGYLPPGLMNDTGKPEPVFTSGQWSRIERLVEYVDRSESGGHGDTITVVTQSDDPHTIARILESKRSNSKRSGTMPPLGG